MPDNFYLSREGGVLPLNGFNHLLNFTHNKLRGHTLFAKTVCDHDINISYSFYLITKLFENIIFNAVF